MELPLTSPSPETALRCANLHKYLGDAENRVHVLNDISLELSVGKIYTITGPSGCGKSTLLYLFGLLDRPNQGQIWLGGQETTGLSDEPLSYLRNQEIGFVFQFHFLLRELTALENIKVPMRQAAQMSNHEMNERASHLLSLVGLGDKIHRRADHLSGGEQQRVAIARSLANHPRLVLADEPTGNLDVKNSHLVFELLQKLARETGLTLFIVTHNPQLAEASDFNFHMEDGKLHQG